jgi:hypothetical protein
MSISALRSARLIFSVMAVTVFSALVLVGCGKDDDDDGGNDKSLIGTWEWKGEEPLLLTITFTDKTMTLHEIYINRLCDPDGLCNEEIHDGEGSYPYTTSGSKITVVDNGKSVVFAEYSIKGDELTLIHDDDGNDPLVLVRKK